ncbi:hypothetical protein [Nucisporomicrobium flavum]|uniref:hypothetical protein n=1 Tax=Nucisporomicrobium flavum TaxID=2785915 RepID=UPI0018F57B97|nr:hypothetical protein [Nucisporomicrobium flavum]
MRGLRVSISSSVERTADSGQRAADEVVQKAADFWLPLLRFELLRRSVTVMAQKVLRLIGYWRESPDDSRWPDVRDFVSSGTATGAAGSAVAAYLRSGTPFAAAAGFSPCRICGGANGGAELTDGEYFVWPEGLSHYVEVHGVVLPEEVVAVARRGVARAVDSSEFVRKVFDSGEIAIDDEWWGRVGDR